MVEGHDERIIYDDPPGPEARWLAAPTSLMLVVALAASFWVWSTDPAQWVDGSIETPRVVTGFNATDAFVACDDDQKAIPDFSIVVAPRADQGQGVSQVVHFVVVADNDDVRRGQRGRSQGLCTLP